MRYALAGIIMVTVAETVAIIAAYMMGVDVHAAMTAMVCR
jgi:hypothetical protein